MFAKAASAIALVSAASVVAQGQQFTVATPPQAVQCQPLQLTWQGGQPPYYPTITKPGDTSQAIVSLPQTSDTKVNGWKVKVPAGQKFTIQVCDSTGQCQASAPVGPVRDGSSDCLGGSGGSSSSGGGSGGAAAGGGSSGSKSSGGDSSSKSSSQGGSSSSSSEGGKSSSSSQGGSSSSQGGSSPSSSGGGAAAGGQSSAASSPSDSAAPSPSSSSDSGNGAATFSGVPAVIAGVVGLVVAALI